MEIVKKNHHKKLIRKLKINKNYSETFNQIRYNIIRKQPNNI